MAKLLILLTFCVTSCVAQQLARETCDASRRMVDVDMTNANVVLGGLFEIREPSSDGYGCAQPAPDLMQIYEAARWTISELNRRNFMNGIRMGMKAYDTCSSVEQSLAAAYMFYPQSSSRAAYCSSSTSQINLGFLGPMSSWTSVPVAALVKNFPAPAISPRGQTSVLSNKILYPTFLRTIPSTVSIARALLAVFERLQWNRIVMVYTEDAFARDGLDQILKYALTESKCVIQAIPLKNGDTEAQHRARLAVLQRYDVNGGLFWGPSADIKVALAALDSLVQQQPSVGRIQWIFTGMDTIQTYSERVARGALAIRPSVNVIEEFKNYWVNLQETNPPAENPWFQDWYMTTYNCKLPGVSYQPYVSLPDCVPRDVNTKRNEYIQSAYVETTIKAIYAYAVAVRNAQRDLCPGQSGFCSAVRTMDARTFQSYLENARYTFSSTDGMSGLDGQTVAFDSNGDIETSSFTIWNYVNNRFQNVGTYENSILNLNISTITFYDNFRQTQLSAPPTSLCPAGGCQNCLLPNTDYSYTYFPGDILVGGLFSLRNSGADPMSCGATNVIGSEWMMGLKYALGNYRAVLGNTVLPGVDLGALVVDSCANKYVASAFLNDLLTNRKTFKDTSGGNIDTEFLRSFIGGRTSSNALDSSRLLGQYKMPEIEASASSDHLGNRMMYPYFNRAIPPIDAVNSAMISILKKFGWSYAQIVYMKGSYGQEGMMNLKKHAAKAQICIAGAYSSDLGGAAIVDKLRENREARAVVIFGYPNVVRMVLEAVKNKNATGEFIFIGDNDWADSESAVAGLTDIADGSFTIRHTIPSVSGFNQYLATFNSLDAIRADPVLSKYYERMFECYLNSGNRGSYTQPCPFQTVVSTSSYTPYVIHAVFSMAQALHNTLKQICGTNYNGLCNAFRDRDAVSSILLQQLRNISYNNTQTGQIFRLLNGEGTSDLDILNYKNNQGYADVGKFSTTSRSFTTFLDFNIRLPGGASLSSMTSVCTQKCLECYMYQQQPFLYIPGDIMLGGLFSISNPQNQGPFTCGSIKTSNGFQYTAAMQYAIEMVNNKQAPVSLNEIRLGGLALDHCNNQDRPFSLLSSIYSGLMDRSLQMMGMTPSTYKNGLARKIAAWLTDNTASTHEAGEFLQPFSIPIVSPSATSTSLMNISSFYRTIQGDDTIAMAMVKVVKSLNLPYVQVVHAASAYGRGGLSAVKAAGQQEGICVISSTEYDSSMTAEAIIQRLTNSPTHVVIVYLGTSDMTNLLRAKASSTDPKAATLVFVSPEPYTQVVQNNGGTDATNMLSIRLKTPTLNSFKAYLDAKTSSGYMDNPFFARYYMTMFNCNLPGYYSYPSTCTLPLVPLSPGRGAFAMSNFISSTVNAVYAATYTLDATLKQLCGEDYDGICNDFYNAADLNIRLVENLRQTNFNSMGNNFRFLNREGNTGYDILRFDGSNYQTVGSYEGAALQVNSGLSLYYRNINSSCNNLCLECTQTGLNFSYIPGDILLGGVFDVHDKGQNPFSCGDINTLHGFQLLEAFHYAINEVNSKKKDSMFADILRGTTLGGVGLDSCESAVRTGYLVSNIHNGITNLAKNGIVIDPDDIDLYIGGYASDRSIYLARILSDLKMPQISYAATSTALLDHFRYPYFYRTVPADDNQARAMISFLDANDIRYVQVLYTQSNYGEFGAAAFERLAPEKRICVGQMVRFPDNGTVSKESSNDVVTQLLAKPVANTIVVFAGTSYINALLRAVKRNPAAVGKFRFIGSETWANNEDAILGVEEIAKGSITFNLKTANLKVYDDYLSGKTPANSQDNPWFGDYYQEMQNCYLTLPDDKYPKKCPQTPENIISSIRYKQDPGVLHVINSVYAAAFAIDYTLKELCGANYTTVCEAYRNRRSTRDAILRNLQRVEFEDPSGENFEFTDRREGNKGYDVYNLKFIPVKGYVYRKVGTYSNDGQITSDFTPDYDGSCTRQDACAECPTIRNVGQRYAIAGPNTPDPDALTVIGIFDIHDQGTDPYRCGKISRDGLRQFLSFFYAMSKVVPTGLNIRTVAIDTCSNSLRTSQDIYNLLNGRGLCNSKFENPGNIKLENIVGFVVSGNENTLGAARVLDPFKVTYISPSASSIIFNNTEVYSHLARTTAPRGQMLKGIAAILKSAGWDYVVAVSSSWRFDDGGYGQFISVSGEKTCIRSASNLPVNPTFDDAKNALQQLMAAEGSNVIVLFTTENDTLLILNAAKELNVLDKFFWVFTDEDAESYNFPSGYYFKGMILKPQEGLSQGYIDYASGMTYNAQLPDLNSENVPKTWYEEYYQHHFRCRLVDAEFPATEYTKFCSKKEAFNGSAKVNQERHTMSTIAASYALVNGLTDMCGRGAIQVCKTMVRNWSNRELLFSKVLNISAVTLDDLVENKKDGPFELKFNSERYWNPGYIAWNWEYDSRAGQLSPSTMLKLGDWKGDELININRSHFADFTSTCPPGAACGCVRVDGGSTAAQTMDPQYTEPRNYYLYGFDRTKIHQWPVWAIAVAVLTSLGLIIAILATLILLFTYPIRGGTTVLGFAVLLGIIGIYAINFAFFLPASFAICATRRFCMGVIYMIVFASLLVKAVDNWRYGDMEWEDQKKYSRITSACSLFMIAIGLVLVQAIIPIEWIILVPPTASKMVNSDLHDYWWCDPVDMYDIGLVLSFIFVMFIVLLTSIFAAMSWDSEVNNRESRWILIASICTAGCFLVWMIVTTNAGPTFRDPAVAIANFVNATALLICIPLRKMALLVKYKRGEKLEEEPGVYDQIYANPGNGYPNSGFDPDFELTRQDSKQDSEVAF